MHKPFITPVLILTCSGFTMAAELQPADFHRNLYTLQQQLIAHRTIRKEEEKGDYNGAAGKGYQYIDTRYYDTNNGNLLSRVRRDASKPELIHIVEVNIYENDKLVRDFGSLSAPWSPLYPSHSYINLHHYNGELHSYRQYDIYGQVQYEFCNGKLGGNPVRISLDGSDINSESASTITYKQCFDGINKDWGQYKIPH